MTTTTLTRPLSFAGLPAGSWAFAIRTWIAVVVALAVSFWLDLEAPSSAAVTVALLAAPTRGPALEKASYRVLGTVVGVTASIAITALFSQTRDLLLAAFAVWIGLCVFAAGLLDGSRAYAAVLSGYTVAIIAIQQIDSPGHVFESSMARGAAILVGIAAITIVNDVLAHPDNHPQLASRLAALQRRVRDYANALVENAAADLATAAQLLRDIAALRPEITTLAAESASGAARGAAARNTAVALVAEVYAARALRALPATADAAVRETAALDLNRRDDEVRAGLAALNQSTRPPRTRRMPLFRSYRAAVAAGLRATLWVALISPLYVLAGWPAAAVSFSLILVVIGLGATTPDPRAFTIVAFLASPLSALLAGTLEFLVLDGVTELPLLALALAPFVIGTTLAKTSPHPVIAGIGRICLIFGIVILNPANPQVYDPDSFLFASVFLCTATALMVAVQFVIPPASGESRQGWLLASARRDFAHVLSGHNRGLAPEEAMFRDATRIAQIMAAGKSSPAVAEALAYFDRAAAVRLSRATAALPREASS